MTTQTVENQPVSTPLPDTRAHFGLTGAPFTREIPPTRMWRHPGLDEFVSDLEATVSARDSAAVIAPSGAGKTALIRRLVDKLPEARYRVADIKVTAVGARDLYRSLACAMGVEPRGTWPSLLESLQAHANALAATEARRTVLIVDEAQDLRPGVLATLRMLTNFKLDSELLISLILIGDTGLDSLLHRPDMEAMRSRLSCVIRLRLLNRGETKSYIDHRLDIVGARTQLIDEPAVEAVYDYTRGNIRAIDHLCRTALDLAARRTLDSVDAGTVTAARKKLL